MTLYTITDQTRDQLRDHARTILNTGRLSIAHEVGVRIVEILDNEAKQIEATMPGMTELAQRVVGKHPALAEGYTAKTPTDLLVDAYKALLSLPGTHGWRLGNQHVLVALRDAIAKYTGRTAQQVQEEMEAETIDMRTSMVAVFGDALPKCTIPEKLADNVSASSTGNNIPQGWNSMAVAPEKDAVYQLRTRVGRTVFSRWQDGFWHTTSNNVKGASMFESRSMDCYDGTIVCWYNAPEPAEKLADKASAIHGFAQRLLMSVRLLSGPADANERAWAQEQAGRAKGYLIDRIGRDAFEETKRALVAELYASAPPKAPSDPLVAGKFSRGVMTGGVDYGFTFRRASNPEHDFYVTIGHIAEGCDLVGAVTACIERSENYQWVADAIIAAYNKGAAQ